MGLNVYAERVAGFCQRKSWSRCTCQMKSYVTVTSQLVKPQGHLILTEEKGVLQSFKELIIQKEEHFKKGTRSHKSKQVCHLTDTTVLCRQGTKASEAEELTYLEYIFTPMFSGCQGASIEFKQLWNWVVEGSSMLFNVYFMQEVHIMWDFRSGYSSEQKGFFQFMN